MVFASQVRVYLWNFLPSWWGWDHQVCSAEVRLVHIWQPYLTTVRVHIMTRINQQSKERPLSLTNKAQSVRKIVTTLSVYKYSRKNHQAQRWNWLRWWRPKEDRVSPLLFFDWLRLTNRCSTYFIWHRFVHYTWYLTHHILSHTSQTY